MTKSIGVLQDADPGNLHGESRNPLFAQGFLVVYVRGLKPTQLYRDYSKPL